VSKYTSIVKTNERATTEERRDAAVTRRDTLAPERQANFAKLVELGVEADEARRVVGSARHLAPRIRALEAIIARSFRRHGYGQRYLVLGLPAVARHQRQRAKAGVRYSVTGARD
jgi:hypothetical protein